ncbi:N-formylglutamate amidohydrolase [Candidatus Terasakiella magnetica]|uniref:N-formylglutamate amidohydrolase n=1 Tax=Candidatus Terasakiella magnetica TaxID=1867952 RepID=A0A1C3RJT1_9PROT|nr:N-formylglutamate amidohydrolase [Candidatus Terasakiella magnetica]SCA57526.1 N-formylglutamate amidohydrolase [Candidatus Terasakiella magnetica]
MVASNNEAQNQDMHEASQVDASYTLLRPKKQTSPVVYASPHSGRCYPKDFVENSPLDPIALRRSEDAFVDELYEACVKQGSPLLKANYPRAYLDVNREPYELDPAMFEDPLPSYVNIDSPRAQAGLGTIAKMVTNGNNIYAHKLKFEEADQRIKKIYHPYHSALRQMIEQTHKAYGACLLIDCHSMPSGISKSGSPPHDYADIILGDRFGSSCASWITDHLQNLLEDEGFIVKRNRPYAGGFTTQHYGRPDQHIHTVQIELNRALYMDEATISPNEGFEKIKKHLNNIIAQLSIIDDALL